MVILVQVVLGSSTMRSTVFRTVTGSALQCLLNLVRACVCTGAAPCIAKALCYVAVAAPERRNTRGEECTHNMWQTPHAA